MKPEYWYLTVGILFLGTALAATLIQRLPLSSALVYIAAGVLIGPHVLGLLQVELVRDAAAIERIAEVALLISLFAAGMNLRAPWTDRRWLLALRLALPAMILTIGCVILIGRYLIGLPWGVAVLLGGILAPTDPVLATDVQVEDPYDPSKLRFGLTGEAGLNDGAAMPFVLLGLGILHAPEGATGWEWVAKDVLWSPLGGVAIGWLTGLLTGRYVLHLREVHRHALGLGYFLALGLIGMAYGLSMLLHTSGFLAVFAAGLAVRRIELQRSGVHPRDELQQLEIAPNTRADLATDPEKAPIYLAQSLLDFTNHLEQLGEVAVVTIIGALLPPTLLAWDALWLLLPLLFLVVRPVAVLTVLTRSSMKWLDRLLIGWFGIRGIGSVYYLAYVIRVGVDGTVGKQLAAAVLATVTGSILLHGLSVTPLMSIYSRRLHKRRNAAHDERSDPPANTPRAIA